MLVTFKSFRIFFAEFMTNFSGKQHGQPPQISVSQLQVLVELLASAASMLVDNCLKPDLDGVLSELLVREQ